MSEIKHTQSCFAANFLSRLGWTLALPKQAWSAIGSLGGGEDVFQYRKADNFAFGDDERAREGLLLVRLGSDASGTRDQFPSRAPLIINNLHKSASEVQVNQGPSGLRGSGKRDFLSSLSH